MTRDEWKELEASLVYPSVTARLKCDDRDVGLVALMDGMRLVICIFRDSNIGGQWSPEDRKRFLRPVTRCALKFTQKEERLFGKKWCAESKARATFTYYRCDWLSFRSLARHLRNNNQSIEWIRENHHAGA